MESLATRCVCVCEHIERGMRLGGERLVWASLAGTKNYRNGGIVADFNEEDISALWCLNRHVCQFSHV